MMQDAVTLPSTPRENPTPRQKKNEKRRAKIRGDKADKRQRLGTDTPDDLANDGDLDMHSNEESDSESETGSLNTEHGNCSGSALRCACTAPPYSSTLLLLRALASHAVLLLL